MLSPPRLTIWGSVKGFPWGGFVICGLGGTDCTEGRTDVIVVHLFCSKLSIRILCCDFVSSRSNWSHITLRQVNNVTPKWNITNKVSVYRRDCLSATLTFDLTYNWQAQIPFHRRNLLHRLFQTSQWLYDNNFKDCTLRSELSFQRVALSFADLGIFEEQWDVWEELHNWEYWWQHWRHGWWICLFLYWWNNTIANLSTASCCQTYSLIPG